MLTITILTNICWFCGVVALLSIVRKLNKTNSDLLNEQYQAKSPKILEQAAAYQKIIDQKFIPNVMALKQENGELKTQLKNAGIKMKTTVKKKSKAEAIISKLESNSKKPVLVFGEE